METLDLGNNELVSRGLIEQGATLLALTYSQSKTYSNTPRGRAAATRWLAARDVVPDGTRI